jgi:hypothetical protein
LPDICGKLQFPEKCSRERYTNWFNKYLRGKYTSKIGPKRIKHTFLSGSDCYALRCALLHEGVGDISAQKAQSVLSRFHFVFPPQGGMIHWNQFNNVLQLQVDIFCKDLCEGVKVWLDDVGNDETIKSRMENILKIYPPGFSV